MHRLTVAPSGTHFLNHGVPFFYLADTLWCAFTNLTPEEWTSYLMVRKSQGFNALQINILPQWDRSLPDQGIHPFRLRPDGTYDFSEIEPEYFSRASRMLVQAVNLGFIPVLVILWSNYVEGTFFDNLEGRSVMPLEHVESYVSFTVATFARFHPIYLVSGDTNFSDTSVQWYLKALRTLKKVDPEALAGLHLCGGAVDRPDPVPVEIPPLLFDTPLLDFQTFQSGHFHDFQHRARTYAQFFRSRPIRRPLFNAEPCYEGWSHGGRRYGPRELRLVIWQSLLAGASAGLAYGAQGLWQWHKEGCTFPPSLNDGKLRLYQSEEPPIWCEALRGPAALEASFTRELVLSLGLMGLVPEALPPQSSPEVLAGSMKGRERVVVYLPEKERAVVPFFTDDYDWLLLTLGEKAWGLAKVEPAGQSTRLHGVPDSDCLVVALKKSAPFP